mmetsp:Transcript_17859/g.52141  ORF Transcript_17859/g.52141 Transcript_17859/m.52141 type:complete len:261 (-) Transcript_17859:248-1030(-)
MARDHQGEAMPPRRWRRVVTIGWRRRDRGRRRPRAIARSLAMSQKTQRQPPYRRIGRAKKWPTEATTEPATRAGSPRASTILTPVVAAVAHQALASASPSAVAPATEETARAAAVAPWPRRTRATTEPMQLTSTRREGTRSGRSGETTGPRAFKKRWCLGEMASRRVKLAPSVIVPNSTAAMVEAKSRATTRDQTATAAPACQVTARSGSMDMLCSATGHGAQDSAVVPLVSLSPPKSAAFACCIRRSVAASSAPPSRRT